MSPKLDSKANQHLQTSSSIFKYNIFKYLQYLMSSTHLTCIVSSTATRLDSPDKRKSCAHDPNSPTGWMSLCRGTSFTTSQTSATACLGRTWSMWWSPKNHGSESISTLAIWELIEGSLEVKLPTIWTVEKQRWEESEEKRSEERRCRCAKR